MGSFKFLLLFPIWRFYYFIHSPKTFTKRKRLPYWQPLDLLTLMRYVITVSLLFQYEQLVYLHLIF